MTEGRKREQEKKLSTYLGLFISSLDAHLAGDDRGLGVALMWEESAGRGYESGSDALKRVMRRGGEVEAMGLVHMKIISASALSVIRSVICGPKRSIGNTPKLRVGMKRRLRASGTTVSAKDSGASIWSRRSGLEVTRAPKAATIALYSWCQRQTE